jgi:hypothetical protein
MSNECETGTGLVLDIFELRDESPEESDNLTVLGVVAQEIVEDLEAALEQFREIANDLVEEPPENQHIDEQDVKTV